MRIESPAPQTEPSLREIREKRRLSLRETARRSRIDPAQLSRVERGRAGLSVDAAARLAAVLGMRGLPKRLAPFRRPQ
jgi:transcriptional regulator with XRE-family HTH domain